MSSLFTFMLLPSLVNCLWYKSSLYHSNSIISIHSIHCLSSMQFLPVTYLLSLLVISSLAQDECFFCASPELEENWEVTNLPNKPDGITFTDECQSDQNTDNKKSCGTGVCYEAIIPLNNRATYLRGCYADFIPDPNITRANLATPFCTYGTVSKAQFTDNRVDKSKPVAAYAASRWCLNKDGEETCNAVLKYNADLFKNTATYFSKKCPIGLLTEKTCVDCAHSAGSGDCSAGTTTTCKGAFCSKYEGYLNGDAVVVRTCSPTNPFYSDQCEWMDITSDFQLFGITIKLPYKAWHCFCTGDSCNPSSPVSSSLLISLVLPLLLSRFIPF